MKKIDWQSTPLYFVTDHDLNSGRTHLEVIRAAVLGGIKLVQFRDKQLSDEEFLRQGREVVAFCRDAGVTCLINDRIELAAELNADGVHLGQADAPVELAREKLSPGAMIGLSTHNSEELRLAHEMPVTYVNIGPMFPTATKKNLTYPFLGEDEVFEMALQCQLPWTTMGGIKKHHLAGLFSRGVHTVAMVSEISMAPDVTERVKELLTEIEKGKKSPQD